MRRGCVSTADMVKQSRQHHRSVGGIDERRKSGSSLSSNESVQIVDPEFVPNQEDGFVDQDDTEREAVPSAPPSPAATVVQMTLRSPSGRAPSPLPKIRSEGVKYQSEPLMGRWVSTVEKHGVSTYNSAIRHRCRVPGPCCRAFAPLHDTNVTTFVDSVRACQAWEFDVFAFNKLTHGATLTLLCNLLMNMNHVPASTSIPKAKLTRLFLRIEQDYNERNPYHNALHAADVTQSLTVFLRENFFMHHLSALDYLCAVLSAAGHDVAHPGTLCAQQYAVVRIASTIRSIPPPTHTDSA